MAVHTSIVHSYAYYYVITQLITNIERFVCNISTQYIIDTKYYIEQVHSVNVDTHNNNRHVPIVCNMHIIILLYRDLLIQCVFARHPVYYMYGHVYLYSYERRYVCEYITMFASYTVLYWSILVIIYVLFAVFIILATTRLGAMCLLLQE